MCIAAYVSSILNPESDMQNCDFRLFFELQDDPVTWSDTYTRLVALLKIHETQTANETGEIESFLDAILRTEICKLLENFLVKKGKKYECLVLLVIIVYCSNTCKPSTKI